MGLKWVLKSKHLINCFTGNRPSTKMPRRTTVLTGGWISSSQSNAYLVKSDFRTNTFFLGGGGVLTWSNSQPPRLSTGITDKWIELMDSPHPWFPRHPNTCCFHLPAPSEPAVGHTAPVNSPYKREVFCLLSFINQFDRELRQALQLLQEKKQEQAGSTMGGQQQLCCSPSPGARGCNSALPLVQLWGWKLTNSSVQQLPGAILLWPHKHYRQNKRGNGNGALPRAGTTFFNDSLYLCHLEVSRELHSSTGCWLRKGADLGSYSPSITHIHIHT